MSDHDVPPSMCPRCGRLANAAMEVGGERAPNPGDLGVCINCAGVNRYNADLLLVPLTPAEWEELPSELQRDIRLAQRAVALMLAQIGPPVPTVSGWV